MNKKSAFTLAELLIVTAIISILLSFGINAFKSIDKSVKYAYSNTYYALDRALYNALLFSNLRNPFVKKEIDNGAEVDVPDEEHTIRLCRMLTEYINTHSQNCEAPAVSDLGTDLTTPHFISSNGIRFYISNLMPDDDDAPHKFMLIFADLNGLKEPNSMVYNPPDQEPDIFAFAALDIGRICPLGPPEIDPNYLKTRVLYYDFQDVTSSVDPSQIADQVAVTRFSNVSKPYYISKAEAWGYYLANNPISEDYYIEANPLTYNDYVRTRISDDSEIYAFLNGGGIPTAPPAVTLRSESVANGGYNCAAGSDVECEVIIDKYVY